jgi:hypothetical protein
MIETKRFLNYCQRTFEQRLRIGIAPLLVVQRSQIIQRLRNAWMIGTECLLPYRERAFKQRLGVGITTLLIVERRKITERCCNIRMIRTKQFFPYCFSMATSLAVRRPSSSSEGLSGMDRTKAGSAFALAIFSTSPATSA